MSLTPIFLISAVVVCVGYIGITQVMTESVNKATPKSQIEDLKKQLGEMENARAHPSTPLQTTPIQEAAPPAPQKKLQNDIKNTLQQAEQQRLKQLQGFQQ